MMVKFITTESPQEGNHSHDIV